MGELWRIYVRIESTENELDKVKIYLADPSGSEVQVVGLRPLACWDLDSNPTGGMDVCLL